MKTHLILCLLISLFFIGSCEDDKITDIQTDLTGESYIDGYPILLATSEQQIGIMKVVTEKSLLRGVIYRYDKEMNFNLFDDVFFQIKEINGVQYATDIKKELGENEELLSDGLQEKLAKERIAMNLHNAAVHGFEHDEYKIHKRGHINNNTSLNFQGEITIHGKIYTPISIQFVDPASTQILLIRQRELNILNRINNSGKEAYFQIETLIDDNGQEQEVIIGVSSEHAHFGDRNDYESEGPE